MGAALLLQPFVHVCSPRYWPVFAPLFAIGLGLAVQLARERGRTRVAGRERTILFGVQVGLGLGFVLVAAGLVVVAG